MAGTLQPAGEIAAAVNKAPPGASEEWRDARRALLAAEIDLRRQTEAVAAQRRALPPGPELMSDFTFDGLGVDEVPAKLRFADLFREGTSALVIYHYMFPRYVEDDRPGAESGEIAKLPLTEQPCPSCTTLLDQLDAAAPHFEAAGGNLVVMAKTALPNLLAVARDRSWRNLRLISSAGSDFDRLYHGEDDGQQNPIFFVLSRSPEGTIRFFWSSELTFTKGDPGQDHRTSGTVEPFWNLLDFTPDGRGEFREQMQHHCCDSLPKQEHA